MWLGFMPFDWLKCKNCDAHVHLCDGLHSFGACAVDGVTFATADIAKKQLEIEGSVDEAELKAAIEAAGFEFGVKA